ncbi:hypothetical protein NL676_038965 [Syzygium grande]|nr:hypothetical protein NL676_038965 [Syzygium grande]
MKVESSEELELGRSIRVRRNELRSLSFLESGEERSSEGVELREERLSEEEQSYGFYVLFCQPRKMRVDGGTQNLAPPASFSSASKSMATQFFEPE